MKHLLKILKKHQKRSNLERMNKTMKMTPLQSKLEGLLKTKVKMLQMTQTTPHLNKKKRKMTRHNSKMKRPNLIRKMVSLRIYLMIRQRHPTLVKTMKQRMLMKKAQKSNRSRHQQHKKKQMIKMKMLNPLKKMIKNQLLLVRVNNQLVMSQAVKQKQLMKAILLKHKKPHLIQIQDPPQNQMNLQVTHLKTKNLMKHLEMKSSLIIQVPQCPRKRQQKNSQQLKSNPMNQ